LVDRPPKIKEEELFAFIEKKEPIDSSINAYVIKAATIKISTFLKLSVV